MKMFIDSLPINRLFLSFWDIFELFSKRNEILFDAGATILITFLLCWKFLPVSIKTGKKTKWIYRLMPFVGVAIIMISFLNGDGSGWGWGMGSGNGKNDNSNSQSSEFQTNVNELEKSLTDNQPEKDIERMINENGKIIIRVQGKKVNIGNVEIENEEAMRNLLDQYTERNVKIMIIDDFSDYATYLWVYKYFTERNIIPEEVSE